MKKKIFLLATVALLTIPFMVTSAQDIITKTNGDEIKVKVTEVNANEVKYKKFENVSGPTYAMAKSDIFMITYENGEKDVFKKSPVSSSVSSQKSAQNQTVTRNVSSSPKTSAVQNARSAPKTSAVENARPNQTASISQEESRKFYLALGLSGFLLNDAAFGGGNLTFGFMPSPKGLLTLEVDGGPGSSKQKIGSYSYEITTTQSGQPTKTETFYDGKVSYGYSYFTVVLGWNWVFNMSDNWRFRVGPCVGFLDISGSDSYSPTSYQGTAIKGIPNRQFVSKSAPMGGALVGATWNFSKRWFLDLNYRLSFNPEIDFPAISVNGMHVAGKTFGSLGNRLNLALGYRF